MRVIYFILMSVFIIYSCEEIIDINLNDSDPTLVGEGIMLHDSVCQIRLSHTSNYFDTSQSTPEEDAIVVIRDSEGRSEILNHTGNGVYRGADIRGLEGLRYTISVTDEKGTYSAESKLIKEPEIIQLEYELLELPHYIEEKIYTINSVLFDDTTRDDYYLFRYYRNGEMLNDYYTVYTDRFVNSDTIAYSDFRLDFYQFDTVRVEVYAIDRNIYDYFNLVNDVLFSAMRSSTPYNPQSSFSPGILGYFMAASYDSETIIID